MPITTKERKYLKNKYKGGKNNSKGAVYESYYATYQIASFMNQYTGQLNDVHLSSQLEETFVDDLLIEDPDVRKIYHQLKDVKELTWKTGKSHSLEYDFTRQMEVSSEKCEDFELKLIYSNPISTVSTIPTGIASCASAVHFPSCSSINQLLLSYLPFKEAIRNIALPPVEDDELSGIAAAILGAWNSVEQKSVSLQQISDIVRSLGKGTVNIRSYPTVSVSDRCREIFSRLGITFHENGSTVHWSYKQLEGKVPWTNEKERKVEKANPATIWELMELVN